MVWNLIPYAHGDSLWCHWRLQDFGSGGGGIKGKRLGRRQRRVSGGEGPPDGSEVSFLKTIQSIRKWIHFSKISTFFLARKSIFPKEKNSKIGHISQEFLIFFEIIFKILIFLEELYKSREIPDELYYLVETFIKKAKQIA